MQTTDPRQLAQELMARTASLGRIYGGMGLGAGALLGAALLANGGDLRQVGAAMGAVLGGFIGHSLGATRSAAMRLQAITYSNATAEPTDSRGLGAAVPSIGRPTIA